MDADIDGELGLKVLCEGLNPTVDIVAVHGLGANPRYAWVAKRQAAVQQAGNGLTDLVSDKDAKKRLILIKIPIVDYLIALLYFLISLFVVSKTKNLQDDNISTVNWLKDLLPREIPHARIMTFNYTSRWHKNAPKQSLNSCAELLLFSLCDLREKERNEKRPLILIGHSFGGNVIEQVCIFHLYTAFLTRNCYSIDDSVGVSRGNASFIAKATVGIIFLGTPHRGSECVKWGQLIAWSGNRLGLDTEDRILKDLQKDSEVLKNVLHEFSLWLFRMSVPSICFYEQFKTDYGARFGGKWKEMVVDEKSACLDGHHKLPLPADHLKLNKFFGSDDNSFQCVCPHIRRMAEDSGKIVHNRYDPQPIILNDLNSGITETKHINCLRALHETNPPDDLAAIRRAKMRVKDTCEWLLLRKEYTEWVVSEKSQLLRLEGSPGIGKTVLASFLVEELEKRAQKNPYMTFAYYFCDNKDEKRRTATSILRGLILQLLRQHKLFQHIQPDFEVQGEQLFQRFEALWRILLSIVGDSKSGNVFLLIDALDECEIPSRGYLLDSLEKLLSSFEPLNQTENSGRLKILITCRREQDIRRKLGNISTSLAVDTGDVSADLREFISFKVNEISELNEWTSRLKNSVEEALIKKAGGTFLWASLVLKELESTDNDQVRDKLDDFPADLDYLYDTMLSKIERPDAAQVILQIMIATRRPLTLHELAMAYLVNRRKEENILPSEDQLDEAKEIFAVCKQIVYLDKHNGTVNLIHQSVKDYLLSDHLKKNEDLKRFCVIFERANLLVFQICWRYLTLNEFDQGNKIISRQSKNRLQREELSKEYLQRHYFLQYACQEWQEHVVAASSILVTDYEFTKDNLDNASTLRDSWLLCVARKGHEKVVQLLLKNGADVDSKDSIYRQTPLSLAAERGHEEVVQLLLEKGADIDSKDFHNGQTPLSLAAERGREKVIQLLLEKGADVDSKDSNYRQTPLSLAAERGHEEVVQLLLEKGAYVDSKDSCYDRTPLSLAAERGYEKVVQLLLKNGADVDSKDSIYRQTPLSLAAERGHEEVVQLLLEKGANVDSKDSIYRQTPLSLAAERGHEKVVQLLFEKGADIDSKDFYNGQTPLSLAAKRRHEKVVQLLLENGADVDSKDSENGRTPLSLAAKRGHEKVVQLLLEKGADMDSKDFYNGQTPLSLAAERGHEKVIQLLLEKGADVDSKDSNYGRTPLSMAAERGHEAVVRLLLEKGASVDSKDSKGGRTPLSWAAKKGHEAVVQLLLKNGADLKSRLRP